MKKHLLVFICVLLCYFVQAEDGYRLWLRYDIIANSKVLQQYRNNISGIQCNGSSATISAAKEELIAGLEGLLGRKTAIQNTISAGCIVAGTPAASAAIASLSLNSQLLKA